MKAFRVLSAVLVAICVGSSALIYAQGSLAGAAGQAASVPAATGPSSALTRAASLVRESRASALAGRLASSTSGLGVSKSTQVMGYLWTANNGAISDATVQIRNTVTNVVEQISRTNQAGEFVFQNVNAGEYVIEYTTDTAKRVLALGHPFTVSPGETVATFVRLSNGLPMILPNELSRLTTQTATQAVTSAASEGVTAVITPFVQVVPPVFPPPGDPPPPAPPVEVSPIR